MRSAVTPAGGELARLSDQLHLINFSSLYRKDNLTAHIKKQHDTTKQEKCEVVAVPDSTTISCLTTGGSQSVCLPTIAVGDIVLTTTPSSALQDQQYQPQEIFVPQSQ